MDETRAAVDAEDPALPWLRLALAEGFAGHLSPNNSAPLLEEPERFLASARGAAPPEVPGVGRAALTRLASRETLAKARTLLARGRELGFGLLTRAHAAWPAGLANTPNEPLVLWYRGALDAVADRETLAVVGARCPTAYGLHATRAFSEALGLSGLRILSGLARGIDGEAHRSALGSKATTIAVLGSGLDRVYPAEHVALADEILASGGLLLSEYPPGYRAHRGSFPRRNRLIAAMSRGVLVVEAGRRSGALLTAEWAVSLDRPVWAVPGHWSAPTSSGCHALLREGAFVADSPEGLLCDLGLRARGAAKVPRPDDLNEARLCEILARGPGVVDALATEAGLELPKVLVALARLETRGLVECRAGGHYFATRRADDRAGEGVRGR